MADQSVHWPVAVWPEPSQIRLSIHTLPVKRIGPSSVAKRNTTVRLSRVRGTFTSVESFTVQDAFHLPGSPLTVTTYTLSSTLTL